MCFECRIEFLLRDPNKSWTIKVMEIIVRDELMLRCSHLLDPHQHGFIQNKSCSTQLVDFCDSLAISLNQNIKLEYYVIYFDFAKAFDSVNHDLEKLKNQYSIDGAGVLLNFLKKYLQGPKQSVVISNFTSGQLSVLSGVPQSQRQVFIAVE